MTLVSKLQNLAARLNTKFEAQEGPVVFRQVNRQKEYLFSPQAYHNTDVRLDEGVKVSYANQYKTDAKGTIEIGDLMIQVPAHLATLVQLKNAIVLYPFTNTAADPVYAVKNVVPNTVLNGEVMIWQVTARKGG